MDDADQIKQQRRNKIRELEESLFGSSLNEDGVQIGTTRLPDVRKVHEYAGRHGRAEQRASLGSIVSESMMKPFSLIGKRQPVRRGSDTVPLILKLDEDDSYQEPKQRHRNNRLLKSEVPELDQLHLQLHQDPRREMRDKLKSKMLLNTAKSALFGKGDGGNRGRQMPRSHSLHQTLTGSYLPDLLSGSSILADVLQAPSDALPEKEPKVDFENLELPTDRAPDDTFRDLCVSKTFDDLPQDVFDQIPRAVTARQQWRREQQLKRREPQPLGDDVDDHPAASSGSEAPLQSEQAPSSLMTALFSPLKPIEQQRPQSGLDLLLIEQRGSDHPVQQAPEPDQDDEIGHFCAEFSPGFCEANFCIFHCPKFHRAEQQE